MEAGAGPSAGEFLEQLRSATQRWGGAEWLADRVDGEAVIVLFRRERVEGVRPTTGAIEGLRLVFAEFAEIVLGPGDWRIEQILGEAVLEIVEPHELGPRLDVDWADGLCADPADVRWLPDAVDAAARRGRSG